ncbi:MAG: hypothetical protein BGO70_01125 [Bacteroidetes bacterium 43-93]|uniref:hypothetical protein n=1 Tax=uncultured Dysgonomonas sp. TaxID=206096 RepID=UPI0009270A57|nr:hypothetical protein [uncultured Dysgonomonas sp.]MBN9483121.1 hypothetical protein [Bacteroidota bacterium]OJW96314.1 MAG: hypothetical protein BGO70_01125 [Bacteroidetes bacterium 43-93]
MLIIIFFLLLVGVIVFAYNKSRFESKKSWQNFYDGLSISASDFYNKVKEGLEQRNIPNLSYAKESFLESHIFSSKRQYMRIIRAEYVFYVCAAPFGTGTFISEWVCIKTEGRINRIPIISKLAGKDRTDKSFYQIDTESMTRMAIHFTVLDVLNSLTTASGVRGLAELEMLNKGNN